MKRLWLFAVPAAVLALGAYPLAAQTVIGAKSGVINWVEGDAFLNEKPYTMQPSQFGEVKEGMTFRTEEGRAEILLPPGVFFRISEKSSFKMISNRLIDTRVELLSGSGIIEVDDLAKEATVTLVVKDGTVSLNKAGIYRFDAAPAQIKVYKGEATVAMSGETTSVSAGRMLALSGVLASAQKFDVAETDSFDHWSRRRGELVANANISAARQAQGYGGSGGFAGLNPCLGYGGYGAGGPYGTGPFAHPWGTWGYNPYYGFGTYIPCQGSFMNPYGFRFWSPYSAYQAFWAPRPVYSWNPGSTGFGGFNGPGAMSTSAGGYSGAMGASSTPSFSSGSGTVSSAAGMGSSAAGAGGGASAGHGGGGAAAGGGGHGK
jgi:hypothetical protein